MVTIPFQWWCGNFIVNGIDFMLYFFLPCLTKMLGVAQPLGLATPTFIIGPKKTVDKGIVL